MASAALKLEAQQVLDELLQAGLIPFKLKAAQLVAEGADHYTIYFFDSRLHSVSVVWAEGQSFKDIFRTAVRQNAAPISGPLYKSKQ